MSIVGFSLVLTAAFCHATWNYYVKRINAGPELVWLFSAITMVVYCPLAVYFSLKMEDISSLGILFIVGSSVLHMAYFLLLQKGYRTGDLSVIYPVARATGPLLSTILAVVMLGEVATIQGMIGGLIIILGVFMLAGGLRIGGSRAAFSLLFGLGTGAIIGSYTIWDAYAVSVLLLPPVVLDYASSVGRTIFLAPLQLEDGNR